MSLKDFWHRLFGTKTSGEKSARKSHPAEKHSHLSSHDQHAQAGRKGGEAPHVCRGRECHHEEKKK